jgi:hypothetical protein
VGDAVAGGVLFLGDQGIAAEGVVVDVSREHYLLRWWRP